MRRTLGLIAPVVALVLTFGITPAHASTPPALAAPSAASADGLAAANLAWVNAQRAASVAAPTPT